MPQKHASILKRFGEALHAQYDAIAKEPMPQRWVDLIYDLNEKEEGTQPEAPQYVRAPPCRSDRESGAQS